MKHKHDKKKEITVIDEAEFESASLTKDGISMVGKIIKSHKEPFQKSIHKHDSGCINCGHRITYDLSEEVFYHSWKHVEGVKQPEAGEFNAQDQCSLCSCKKPEGYWDEKLVLKKHKHDWHCGRLAREIRAYMTNGWEKEDIDTEWNSNLEEEIMPYFPYLYKFLKKELAPTQGKALRQVGSKPTKSVGRSRS